MGKKELRRLIDAFSIEAAKFHNLRFSTFSVTQKGTAGSRQFDRHNHAVMLWQYYGLVTGEDELRQLEENLITSNVELAGLRGAQLSHYGLLEGEALQLFLRMARRAGSLFDTKTADEIKSRVTDEIINYERHHNPSAKPVSVINDNVLAVWLNYLLYHISLVNPREAKRCRIDLDPFTLSLFALERLHEEKDIGKIDRSTSAIDEIRFKVALSFPGEHRPYVAKVAERLSASLGADSVFYDHDYQSQLARPNLDVLLQEIYRNRTDLIVVFLCAEYQAKPWCGLEWRSIRSLFSENIDQKIMLIRFDDNTVDGVLPIDGYLDARKNKPTEVAKLIEERLSVLSA